MPRYRATLNRASSVESTVSCPVRAPQGPGGEHADHEARGHEGDAQPGQGAEQGEAAEGRAPAGALVELQRQQGGPG